MSEIKNDLQTCSRCHISREPSCFNGGKQCVRCLETRRRYYTNNSEKMIEATKQWQSDNQEKHLETKKLYRATNKEHIHEQLSCGCGSTYSRNHKSTHFKTLKHIRYVDTHPNT